MLTLIPLEFVLVLVLVPYALSRLSVHHGWTGGIPGSWNLLGGVLAVAGALGIMWAVRFHTANMGTLVEIGLTPRYLVKDGPYRFSRNPIYIAVLMMWLGWTLFYGSVANAVVLVMAAAIIAFIVVPFEEEQLERRFGEDYLRYKRRIARWF